MRFRAELELHGKTATGITVPESVVTGLDGGKKPAVAVTLNGVHTYRSSIAPRGGVYLIPVSAEHRDAAGVAAGDVVDVDVVLDDQPRVVEVPADLAAALKRDPAARKTFEALSYSNQRRHVLAIEGAKAAETRQRRIDKAVALFHEGKS